MGETVSNELDARHRIAVLTVSAMLALTVLLTALAFAGVLPTLPSGLRSPVNYGIIWVVILFLGLGAVALRRAKFTAIRLQDIAALKGVSALLATLQKTTMRVALLGGAISILGYMLTAMYNDVSNMRNAAIIAVAVLFYCYPRRSAWQRVVASTRQPADEAGSAAPPAKGTPA